MIKQTIILSNSFKETETLKSLASFGVNTFGKRFFQTLEFARYLLQLSGKTINKEFISNDDLAAQLYHKIKQIEYFQNLSYVDIVELINSINKLRRYIIDNEKEEIRNKLPKDHFVMKNDAIIQLYDLMRDYLDSNNLIDEVGTIRFAYNNIDTIHSIDFDIYEGDKLIDYRLDMALLKKASSREIIISPIYKENVQINTYTKAFSQVNEIEDIISYIYKNNIPFDQCLIASAESIDYSNILINYHDLLKFPLTIGVGQLVVETNPGKLFSTVVDYINNYYHTGYLKKIIYDECFNITTFKGDLSLPESFDEINKELDYRHKMSLDSIITTVGDLKLSFDEIKANTEKLNKYKTLLDKYNKENIDKDSTARRINELPFVIAFADIINKGLVNFINRYSKIINPAVDETALEKILILLSRIEEPYKIPREDIFKAIFNLNVGRRSPQPGSLYFTSINNAISCLRKHLFIVGLSANNYPGKRKEDPIILDRDFEAFGVKDASNKEIENNKNAFFNLVRLANRFKVDVHLSYASYNSITLKAQNASSVIFEAYKLENGNNKTIKNLEDEFINNATKFKTIEYFSTDILPIAKIGKSIADNNKIKYEQMLEEEEEEEETQVSPLPLKFTNKALSASDIENYNKCPYLLYLTKALNIQQPEKIDIFNIIPNNEYGTLAHSLLETLDKNKTSEKEFLAKCEERFDEYFIIHHTDNISLKEKEKQDFIEMMSNAYEMEEYDLGIREKEIEIEYEDTGIKIHGFPDKIMVTTNNEAYIVDYKTGRKINQSSDKPNTLLQCTVYSYIVKKAKNISVNGFEYRYLREENRIKIIGYEELNKCYLELENVMNKIKYSYETGDFPINMNECSKCYHKDVCTRRKN